MVLLALVLLNLPGQTAARFKLALSSLFLPLFGIAGSSQQLLSKGADSLMSRPELARENQELRRENQQLRLLAQQGAEAARENNRLREMLGWQQRSPWKTKSARIVLHDPANWWRTVEIDLGTRDGISNNLPVLDPGGALVGRVLSAGLTRSQVVLLGDPNCRVAALVLNERRDQGILGTATALGNDLVELNFFGQSVDLKPGQPVVTSGLGTVFPKGILIGNIVDFMPVEYGMYTQARVKLAAHLHSLEEVWVVIP